MGPLLLTILAHSTWKYIFLQKLLVVVILIGCHSKPLRFSVRVNTFYSVGTRVQVLIRSSQLKETFVSFKVYSRGNGSRASVLKVLRLGLKLMSFWISDSVESNFFGVFQNEWFYL